MQITPQTRRWWTHSLVWLGLAGGLLLTVSLLFQLAVWLLPGYRQEIELGVTRAIGRPIAMQQLSLTWRWAQPMVEIRQLSLVSDDGRSKLLTAQKLRLGFALSGLLQGRWIPSEINLEGLPLTIDIDAEGHVSLRGVAQKAAPITADEVLRNLRRFDRIKVNAVELAVHDERTPGGDFAVSLQSADLRTNPKGMELRAELAAPGVLAKQIKLKLGFAGNLERLERLTGQWSLDASSLVIGKAVALRYPKLKTLVGKDANLQANGTFLDQAAGESQLKFQAAGIALSDAQAASLLRDLSFTLRYLPGERGGSLQLKNLDLTGHKGKWPTASARLAWQQSKDQKIRAWTTTADFLRLDDLSPWLRLIGGSDEPAWLTSVKQARGEVHALEGSFQQGGEAPRYGLQARLIGLGLGSHSISESAAGLDGLSGELKMDETAGSLIAKADGSTVYLGRAFEAPISFDKLAAKVLWKPQADAAWAVSIPSLNWAALGTSGEGSADLLVAPGRRPTLKLKLDFSAADAARLKPYMPKTWGPGLKHWLTASILKAEVNKARLWIDGPLADFPFHKQASGEWGLDLALRNTRLQYLPEWPTVEGISGALRFRGNGLVAELVTAKSMGISSDKAVGSIENFAESPLLLDIASQGEAAEFYRFLRATPLKKTLGGLLQNTEGQGPVSTDVHLDIPLHADSGKKLLASGVVRLSNNQLQVNALEGLVEQITGKLRFGGDVGVAAEGLTASYLGTPLSASINAAPAGGVEVLNAQFSAAMDTPNGPAERYLPSWLRANLSGTSQWRLALPLSGAEGGHVELSSDLRGVKSSLPQPLAKSAQERLPLSLRIFGDEQAPLRLLLRVPQRLGLALRWARPEGVLQLRGVHAVLGGGDPGLAAADGLQLSGSLDRASPGGWLAVLGSLSGQGGLPFLGAQLTVQHLTAGRFETDAVSVASQKAADGGWQLRFDGAGGSGTASVSADHSRLHLALKHLSLRDTPTAQRGGESKSAETPEPLNPANLPALDLSVDALRIGDVPFGALKVVTVREVRGQTLRVGTVTGGVAELKADGAWRRQGAASSAALNFALVSDDLAKVLQGLGFEPTISGKNANINGKLEWSAAESGLAWARATGAIDLAAENGSLRSVEPGGAGRVLGLFNLYALPRRLLFDFRDVVNKGLSYDRIEGSYDLAAGIATAREVSIKGPSLRMKITGTVDLQAQTLDQTITVTPNTAGVTLGAVLVGGATLALAPPIGVLALLANQVLDKPISQATQFSYKVSGPWADPEIRREDGSAVPEPKTADAGLEAAPAEATEAVAPPSASPPPDASKEDAQP